MAMRGMLTADQLAALVPDGATIMVGGFGLVGAPLHTLELLAQSSARNLTIISNNLGEPGLGLGKLLRNGQIRHAIGSYFTSNPEVVRAVQEGRLTVEVTPQGSFSEAIRAGGAGLGGFYTSVGAGTALATDRETRVINGVEQVFISALTADLALIKADRADTLGNLTYRMTGRNFNPLMATAARTVIAEVEEVVEAGVLDPEAIITPHVYVDYLLAARTNPAALGSSAGVASRKEFASDLWRIVARARRELRPGAVVNLGIGLPTLLADILTPADGVFLHTENGLLGVGPRPDAGSGFEFPVNAGKQVVTALPGAAYFDSATSFAMIRGGHVDVAIMGALQVDQQGNLANWAAPGRPQLGVGGAMDLARGAREVIVMMTHVTKDQQPKLLRQCDLPITAFGCVATVITDLGLFRLRDGACTLVEIAPGVTPDQARAQTGADLAVSPSLRVMEG